jgi:hypothetical protein
MSKSMKAMRVARRISQSFCIVLLLLTCGALSAQNQQHRIRNIVLVHDAWADGSGWKGVYDILVKDGYNVSIVQEPETSFKEDVAATKRVLAQEDGPSVLVAHSYGESRTHVSGSDQGVSGAPGEARTPDPLLRRHFCWRCNQRAYTHSEELNRPAPYALFGPTRCVSQSLVNVLVASQSTPKEPEPFSPRITFPTCNPSMVMTWNRRLSKAVHLG